MKRSSIDRIGAFGAGLLALLIITGCERGAAQDPLAATANAAASQAAPQELASPTPVGVAVTVQSPVATATEIAASTFTPTPIPVATTPVPAAATPTPTAVTPPGSAQEYVVKAGDRLFSIGRQFGVNPYSIAQANNILPPYIIRPGQKLTIPAGGTTPPTVVPGGKTHTVAPGENLFRIALKYGTTVQALAAANKNITNVNLIFVGQVINIP